jgi:hypothetical protein
MGYAAAGLVSRPGLWQRLGTPALLHPAPSLLERHAREHPALIAEILAKNSSAPSPPDRSRRSSRSARARSARHATCPPT